MRSGCVRVDAGGGVSPFATDAVYWPGDEASGPMLGGIGTNDAEAINSPLTAVGPGGSPARQVVGASSQWFRTFNDAAFTLDGRTLYIGGWGYLSALPAVQSILVGEVNPFAFQFGVTSTGLVFLDAWGMTGVAGTLSVAGFGASAWHFIEAKAEIETGEIGVAIDGGAFSAGTFSGFSAFSTHGVGVASRRSLSYDFGWDGRLAGLLIMRSVPSDVARAWLVSAGRVRTSAELLAYRE